MQKLIFLTLLYLSINSQVDADTALNGDDEEQAVFWVSQFFTDFDDTTAVGTIFEDLDTEQSNYF